MSTKEQLEARLEKLTRRADKAIVERNKLEKEEAVKLDRYEEALKELKAKFDIDASEMSASELRKLLQDTQDALEVEIDAWESVVEKAEKILEDFKGLQG